MSDTLSLAASTMGRKSAKSRHARMKEKGVDISTFYSDLRKKGISKRKEKFKQPLTSVR